MGKAKYKEAKCEEELNADNGHKLWKKIKVKCFPIPNPDMNVFNFNGRYFIKYIWYWMYKI